MACPQQLTTYVVGVYKPAGEAGVQPKRQMHAAGERGRVSGGRASPDPDTTGARRGGVHGGGGGGGGEGRAAVRAQTPLGWWGRRCGGRGDAKLGSTAAVASARS